MKAERTLKITGICVLTVVAAFSFAACSGTGTTQETTTVTESATAETTTKAETTTSVTTVATTTTTQATTEAKNEKEEVLADLEGLWTTVGNSGLISKIFSEDSVETFTAELDESGSMTPVGYLSNGSEKINDVVRFTENGKEGYKILLDSGTVYYFFDDDKDYLECHNSSGGYSGADSLGRDTRRVDDFRKLVKFDAVSKTEGFNSYLQNLYKNSITIDGLPGESFGEGKYVYDKYAIADIDNDGADELLIQDKTIVASYDGSAWSNIFKIEEGETGKPNNCVIPQKGFNEVTFLDNGVAFAAYGEGYDGFRVLDDKEYYLLDKGMLGKLNYNMANAYWQPESDVFLVYYYKQDGKIYKELGSGQDIYFDPKEKTESEYEQEKQLLTGGNVINVNVKDFTAENIGL